MKKNKSSKKWLIKRRKDSFFNKAKIQGYKSRSAFKLIEMNKEFNLFEKRNICILDLGSSPGGWSQVMSKHNYRGEILAVDINPMEKIKNVNFLQGDFTDLIIQKKISSFFNKKFDIVLSDMAPNTTGNKNLDAYKTGELCLKAMELAKNVLNNKGIFLSKIFMGSVFNEIDEKAKKNFKKVVKFKPESSKPESREIYIYCKEILKI